MTAPVLIGVDWGGTHVRAMALAPDARVMARRHGDAGALRLAPDDFPAALDALIGAWRAPEIPVLICGMAGGRRGWTEVPYANAPASAEELARGLIRAAPGVFIVPGVCMRGEEGLTDLMRGEETQIMGAGDGDFTAVCPGTHSKWASVSEGRITDFTSFMTGELFAVMKAHSMLGHGMSEGPFQPDAFDDGVTSGLQGAPLTAAMFSVRAGWIDGRLKDGSADYLSGLLIGAEIAGAVERYAAPMRLIGAPMLCERYARALRLAGAGPAQVLDAEIAVAKGLMTIWRRFAP